MSNIAKGKSRLGRGLSSLISVSELPVEVDVPADPPAQAASDPAPSAVAAPAPAAVQAAPMEIRTDSIVPNPHQPRKQFDEAAILSLAASIKSTGLVQPIVVRPSVVVTAATVNHPGPCSRTVRHAPLTAMLSPSTKPSYVLSMRNSRPAFEVDTLVTIPTSSINPVNTERPGSRKWS